MKRLLVIALLLFLVVILSQAHRPQVVAQSGQDATVEKLLIERRNTLRSGLGRPRVVHVRRFQAIRGLERLGAKEPKGSSEPLNAREPRRREDE